MSPCVHTILFTHAAAAATTLSLRSPNRHSLFTSAIRPQLSAQPLPARGLGGLRGRKALPAGGTVGGSVVPLLRDSFRCPHSEPGRCPSKPRLEDVSRTEGARWRAVRQPWMCLPKVAVCTSLHHLTTRHQHSSTKWGSMHP